MQFALVTALATLASGAALQPRQAQEYDIVEFSASCIPHSAMCSYIFQVDNDPSLSNSNCDAMVVSNGDLPNIEDGKCKDNVAYTWSIDKTEGGDYDFKIWYAFNSRSNITYCHTIPCNDVVEEQNGASITERYVGPSNFKASIFEC